MEISLLMSLKSSFIMKLEDACFITEATGQLRNESLVIISELAEGNLDFYIKTYQGLVPEAKIIQLFV